MLNKELDYGQMMEWLNEKEGQSRALTVSYIGKSVFDRPIPVVTIGDKTAQKSVLYVSTHHASENICTTVLLRFIDDYISAYESMGQLYQINMRYLYKTRKIYIVPMLNPDGVEYRLKGISDKNPIKERVLAYNGSNDFSKWNANARGVDLNHNYDAYFEEYKAYEREKGILNGKTKYSGEYAESEPEVKALADFIRYNSGDLEGIITLHAQGEEIYYSSRDIVAPRSEHIAKLLSRISGYSLSIPKGMSAAGGLTDWFIKEYNKPSFTIECGRGENPLPPSQIMTVYTRLKEALFTFPILF